MRKSKKISKEKLPCGRPVPDWTESRFTSKEKRFEVLRKKLDAYVKERQLNQSDSRIQVLAVIANYESHFSASQLITSVSSLDSKVGSATVYRAIQFFVSAGILRETLATDSGEKIYEVEPSRHHDHIVCLDCDAILEFFEPEIETLQQAVLKKLKFREARHRHVIYARCHWKPPSVYRRSPNNSP